METDRLGGSGTDNPGSGPVTGWKVGNLGEEGDWGKTEWGPVGVRDPRGNI